MKGKAGRPRSEAQKKERAELAARLKGLNAKAKAFLQQRAVSHHTQAIPLKKSILEEAAKLDPKHAFPILKRGLGDQNAQVSQAAVEGFVSFGDKGLDFLQDRFERRLNDDTKATILARKVTIALAEKKGKRVEDFLVALVDSKKIRTMARWAAYLRLERMDSKHALPASIRLLASGDLPADCANHIGKSLVMRVPFLPKAKRSERVKNGFILDLLRGGVILDLLRGLDSGRKGLLYYAIATNPDLLRKVPESRAEKGSRMQYLRNLKHDVSQKSFKEIIEVLGLEKEKGRK